MSILISNDDGIYAPGLQALKKAISESTKIKEKIYVVAPDREQSASSHSLTLHRPLRVKQISECEFGVDGTPTDCVLLAIKRLLPQNDPLKLLISGINHGANLGDDVTYSGTVSAALEGAILGIPSMAVSVVGLEKFDFSVAAKFSEKLAVAILKKGLPRGVYLNVNVPGDLVGFAAKGDDTEPIQFSVTQTGKRDYGSVIFEKKDPRNKPYFWIGGDAAGLIPTQGTDCAAILEKNISVTPLRVDVTHYEFLAELRNWEIDEDKRFRRRATPSD